jgi:hypothetical protein
VHDRAVSHEQLRAVIIEADHQAETHTGWRQIPAGGALLVGPQLNLQPISPR